MTAITIQDIDTVTSLSRDNLQTRSGGFNVNGYIRGLDNSINALMGQVYGMNSRIVHAQRTTHSPYAVASAFLNYAGGLRRRGYTGFIGAPISHGTFMSGMFGGWR